jgi:hypothetical protein
MRGFPLLNFLLCLGLGLGVVAPLVWRAQGTRSLRETATWASYIGGQGGVWPSS